MRILTWNARGSKDPKKKNELKSVLEYWELRGDPIVIICLQEVAVQGDTLALILEEKGFVWETCKEGWNGAGKNQMIAVKSGTGIVTGDWGRLSNVKVFDNVRIPMFCEIAFGETKGIIFNYHAEAYNICAGGLTWMMLDAVNEGIRSRCRTKSYDFVVLAGDLNVEDEISGVQRLFGLLGYYNKLDYILSKGIKVKDAQYHTYSTSDHQPLSAELVFGK